MTQMPPEGTEYNGQTFALSSLFVTTDVLRGVTFTSCVLVGPAIIALLGDGTLHATVLDAPGEDAFWVFPDEREYLVGVLGFENCSFYNCRFQRVGIAVAKRHLPILRSGFGL
jgi:hypothetical protein